MTTTKIKSSASNENQGALWQQLDEYRPNIGAPFEVVLCKAVRQKIDSETGDILETEIPNMGGLLKEVAVARALHPRKFGPGDIRFCRKAVNLKAVELANLLGVTPEHLSRCENEGRALSPAADKLLRVIVLKKRYSLSQLQDWVKSHAQRDCLNQKDLVSLQKLVEEYKEAFAQVEKAVFDAPISSVFDPGETLAFAFHLESSEISDEDDSSSDDERWRPAA